MRLDRPIRVMHTHSLAYPVFVFHPLDSFARSLVLCIVCQPKKGLLQMHNNRERQLSL